MANRAAATRKRKQAKAIKSSGSPIKNADPKSSSGRYFLILVLVGLAVAGVMIRVQFLERSLWLDEAWVANSIRAASLRDAIYYDAWLQTTPPLFVALNRVITAFFGTSNIAFRLLPAFFGIASIPLFSFLALRLLKPSFAIAAIVLFIFDPQLILYSQSLKQYSADVFSTVALLVLGYRYLEKRTELWFYSLLAGVVACSFLSYPAMLFWPFVVYITFLKDGLQERTASMEATLRTLPQSVMVMTLGIFVLLINYLLFVMPNKNAALAEFFGEGFYEGRSFLEFMGFYGAQFLSLADSFFFARAGVFRIGAILALLGGLVHLWVSQLRISRLERLATPLLLTAPTAGVLALNVVGLFPLPGFHHRLLLFAFPITVLIFCLGLQLFTDTAARFLASWMKPFNPTLLEAILGSLAAVGLATPVFVFFGTVGAGPIFAEDHEEIEQTLHFMSQRVRSSDVLYVHATVREPFKLYGPMLLPAISRVVHGRIGAPCCPRHDYRNPRRESADEVSREILSLSKVAAGRSLWLLSTDRELHWLHVRRNDVEIFERALPGHGCRKSDEAKFAGIYLGRFDCDAR